MTNWQWEEEMRMSTTRRHTHRTKIDMFACFLPWWNLNFCINNLLITYTIWFWMTHNDFWMITHFGCATFTLLDALVKKLETRIRFVIQQLNGAQHLKTVSMITNRNQRLEQHFKEHFRQLHHDSYSYQMQNSTS